MILQPRHLFFALGLHGILLAFLLFSVECSRTIEAPEPIMGTLVKPSDIPKPSVPAQEAPTPPKPDALPDQGPQQKVQADTQGDEARIQREKQEAAQKQAEEQRKAEDLQRQQEEQRKQAEAEHQRQEAAHQEELRQQQLALEKQKAQAQAEALKKQQEEEARRKQDEARKRQEAAAADLRQQLDQEAQQQQSAMHERQKAEQAKRDAAERRRLAQEVQKQAGQEYGKLAQATWIDQLGAAIHQVWQKPPGTDMSIKCKVRLQVGPTGQVQANIVSPSGNQLFDNSVMSAVYKAQPLPLPDDPSLLNQAIVLTFTPAS
jgi:colicin import membrane protein